MHSRKWPPIWAALFVAAVSFAAGCYVYMLTHPPAPTAQQIAKCKRTYGCRLDELLSGQ